MGEKIDSELVFFVNGIKVVDDKVDPEWTLLYYLRNKLRLCGTKLGCAEGGCGACTVMVSKFDRRQHKVIHLAVNACLAPVGAMHGLAVTTVEGIGSTQTRLHPVQERIAKAHGSQCGFCTPGIVMSMYALLRSMPGRPTMADLEVAFQGNLCRCTGYRPIIEGYRTFTEEWEQQQRLQGLSNGVCGLGKKCCKNAANGLSNGLSNELSNGLSNWLSNGLSKGPSNGCLENCNTSEADESEAKLFDSSRFIPYNPSQEPIFPPELQMSDVLDKQFLVLKGPRATWYRPTTIDELLHLKTKFTAAKIINGNTEIGVEVKFKSCVYPVLIQPSQIAELNSISLLPQGIQVGASTTLSDLGAALKEQIKSQPGYKTGVFKAIVEMLHYFAGKQIRNVGAVGGNIMTGSPISDLNPIFMAAGCQLQLQSKEGGERTVVMDQTFWTGYRRNVVRTEEILMSIIIPFTKEGQYFLAYKQAKRRDDDIAIVNAAFNLELVDCRVAKLSLAFGGMAPTTKLACKTANHLIGRVWNSETLEEAYSVLVDELPLDASAPGGMIQYRRSLTLSLFFKFYLSVNQQLEQKGMAAELTPVTHRSGKDLFHSLVPKSSQYFELVPSIQEKYDLVGRPIVHTSAYKQATGEAKYCDDIPRFEAEVYLALVISTRPHALIVSIDAAEALRQRGVHDFISAKDIPGSNTYQVNKDEEVFASTKVTCQGQVIGAIIAEDQTTAQRAAKLVKIEYQDLSPVIISIEDAIREGSFLKPAPQIVCCGNTEQAFKEAVHILEGEMRLGGQEHFYLETQATIAVPTGEDDELHIYSSTQHPSEMQETISHVLGIPSNRITCHVKRMGGGFGGKESRSAVLGLPVAVAAHKLGRPVRAMLDRDEDMMITGHRHPFLGKYKMAFDNSGKITACEISLYNNAGHTYDLSTAVMERAMFHFNNSIYIPNVTVYGYVCKTNLPSNTAFRGFGGPQGMLIGETMIRQIASYLNKDVVQITELNLFKDGDLTHYNQQLSYCTVRRCWSECLDSSQFFRRRAAVHAFNKSNRWRKRGLAVVPTTFGVAFTVLFLNQAGALVLVYADGSVLISHGGTEMGQGLHTKMIQVVSRALGIPHSYIHLTETSTDKVPNTSPTAASIGSDLNGMALLNACEIINERLKPIKEANPKGTWKDWIHKAYFSRIGLAASGFYKTPDINYDLKTNSGIAFNYFTFGAAVAEVEIDCLTGDHQVIRTDIVMDVGESLNPAIDVGQIEGGFMQGYGLFTLEELIVSPTGMLYSRGPGAYKLPGFTDIPAEFNVSLLKGAPNKRAVYSSKAVGEPPLFLASSIFFAIREAVASAREEVGLKGWFKFYSPATAARIRIACTDQITQKFPETEDGSRKAWNVVP